MNYETENVQIPITVYRCKNGKCDKDNPIESFITPVGGIDVNVDVILSWAKPGCATCSGTGKYYHIEGQGIRIEQTCTCAFKRFCNQLSQEQREEINKRQNIYYTKQKEMKEITKSTPEKRQMYKEMLIEFIKAFNKVMDEKETNEQWQNAAKPERLEFLYKFIDDKYPMLKVIPELRFIIPKLIFAPSDKRQEFVLKVLDVAKMQQDKPTIEPVIGA